MKDEDELPEEELDKLIREKVFGRRYSSYKYKYMVDTPGNRKILAAMMGISAEELDRQLLVAKSIVCN